MVAGTGEEETRRERGLCGVGDGCLVGIITAHEHVAVEFVGVRTGDVHIGKPNVVKAELTVLSCGLGVAFFSIINHADRPAGGQ